MVDRRQKVRERYGRLARQAAGAGCCSSSACDDGSCGEGSLGATLYGADLGEVPDAAALASLGCGNPIAIAGLQAGEVVLDLGSGGGIDAFLAARRVGASGKVYGLDMTDEMLELARGNADAEVGNVEFLKGYIEEIPLPDASVDVIISNCVINLSPDKPQVFREIARVLRPGGRLQVSDIVSDDRLGPQERAERGSYVGCIAGALSFEEYRRGLEAAGLTQIEVASTHEVLDGMHAASVSALKPVG